MVTLFFRAGQQWTSGDARWPLASSDEWLYPAWQFGPGGSIPAGVRNAVKAARAAGLDESRLVALLRRPVGLVGGGRLLDLLFEGRSDYVVDAVRNAATA